MWNTRISLRARVSWALAICLALMSLAACSPFSGQTTATVPGTTCDPATQWRPPAENVALDDLAMVTSDEGWAVGALTPPQPPGAGAPTGVIYHLAHGQWTRLPQTYPSAELSAIAMDSPTDGWVASTSAVTGTGNRALVLHYTGGHWRAVDIPALDQALKGAPGYLNGSIQWISIQMFGPDAGWMFAWTNNPRDPSNPASRAAVVILRYQHGVWTPIPAPDVTPTTEMFTLSAVSADEAWIVGTDYSPTGSLTTLFAHYTNGHWSLWPQTFPGVELSAIAMFSPTDGWAFGSNDKGYAVPLRYDGAAWKIVATPTAWARQRINLMSAAFPVASDITWFPATTVTTNRGTLLEQYANGQWRQIPWPYPEVVPARLLSGAPGELWGIGNIYHMEGCPGLHITAIQQGVFLHYQQGKWSRTILP